MTSHDKLNQPEIDILRLVCLGMTNKEIAHRLATTVPMVKWRTNQAFDKLAVRNRVRSRRARRSSIRA
jgi:DNA-binding NarL/FixJ family response regulator